MPIGKSSITDSLEPTVSGAMAPRQRPPTPPPSKTAATASTRKNRFSKGGRDASDAPQTLSTAEEDSWPVPLVLGTQRPNDLDETSFQCLQSHGFWRFQELYAENNNCRDRIISLPIVKLLTSTVTKLSDYLAENVLPVTALIPVEILLRVSLDPFFAEAEYAGHIMSTLLVVLFGFTDVQLHYIYYTLLEGDPDKIMTNDVGDTPMRWLAEHMDIPEPDKDTSTVNRAGSPRAASSAQTASTVGARGSGAPTYRVANKLPICYPSMIFEHCAKLFTAWKPPPHQDFAAQGKPKHWNDQYHVTMGKDMYDILSLIHESQWVSTFITYDKAQAIFTQSSIQNMVGHMAVEMFANGANFRSFWHLYAFLSVRPTKHGITLRDLQKVPREVESVLPPQCKLNPLRSLNTALEQVARTIYAKGGGGE